MSAKKMLLSYKPLYIQSFAMYDEIGGGFYYTHHFEITYKKKIWFGLSTKVVTEQTHWNAPNKDVIIKQLDSKIGKWI